MHMMSDMQVDGIFAWAEQPLRKMRIGLLEVVESLEVMKTRIPCSRKVVGSSHQATVALVSLQSTRCVAFIQAVDRPVGCLSTDRLLSFMRSTDRLGVR